MINYEGQDITMPMGEPIHMVGSVEEINGVQECGMDLLAAFPGTPVSPLQGLVDLSCEAEKSDDMAMLGMPM